MTKADLGLPSAIQDSTYQQNRDVIMSNLAFMSKAELRKAIEGMFFENKQLRTKVDYYVTQSISNQEKVLEMQTKVLQYYDLDKPHMRVV